MEARGGIMKRLLFSRGEFKTLRRESRGRRGKEELRPIPDTSRRRIYTTDEANIVLEP